MNSREWIEAGQGRLGIELGSTRIKAVLLGEDKAPIASGSHEWENRLENGVWTYTLDDVWQGMQSAYADLNKDVQKQYGVSIKKLAGVGISAMMHGYLVFDENDKLLAPFRTWRNTMTQEASAQLTEAFAYPIPQRWSIAHLWQAILDGESHTKDIRFMTDLDGYVHYMLTGEKVLGVGAASGVFPIDSATCDYRKDLQATFDKLAQAKGFTQPIASLLPKVLCAGENAGTLTKEGAALLDPTGTLQAGAIFCPPEGDAGTGMVATNSVRPTTANVSAGTSVFAMVVLEKDLKKVHSEIDLVTTPSGDTVAMVHCNNCTSDINAWVNL
ncbi:MAG: ATPase, partial [Lachnospiraceae bacterium]|nr:ATPase [Lachnospiraceae bacterium]